jgi:hypothetical protein
VSVFVCVCVGGGSNMMVADNKGVVSQPPKIDEIRYLPSHESLKTFESDKVCCCPQ